MIERAGDLLSVVFLFWSFSFIVLQDFDLILFALVAGFLILRLRSVLGERHEADNPPPQGGSTQPRGTSQSESGSYDKTADSSARGVIEGHATELAQDGSQAKTIDYEESDLEKSLRQRFEAFSIYQQRFKNFRIEHFLRGVEQVFQMVHEAYIKGNLEDLRPLLLTDVYERFEQSIKDRKAHKRRQESTLIGIDSCDVIDMYVGDRQAEITVKIVSSQVNALYDDKGVLLAGNAQKTVRLTDIWVFVRPWDEAKTIWYLKETRDDKPSHD